MSKVFTGAGIDCFGGCLIIFSVSAFKLSSVFWNFGFSNCGTLWVGSKVFGTWLSDGKRLSTSYTLMRLVSTFYRGGCFDKRELSSLLVVTVSICLCCCCCCLYIDDSLFCSEALLVTD